MRHIFFLISIFFISLSTTAQNAEIPTLPEVKVETENGQNKLSWICEYDGIQSIQILRSADSVLSFVAIGNLSKPRKGVQRYTDKNPKLGKNYYKVRVLFRSDLEWFSNTYKVILDSATIAASRGRSLNTGSTKEKGASTDETNSNYTDFYYEPSTQVYTNPYTGHVNISLADYREKRYSLRFYTPKKEEILYISRVRKSQVILDKYNFNARGTYMFKLFNKDEVVETGYVTIY